MKEIVQNVINSGVFNLSDMLKKIDTLWVQSQITDDERTSLIQLANEKADPKHGYIDIQGQVNILFERLEPLESTVGELSSIVAELKKFVEGLGGSVTDPGPGPSDDEYPEWEAWPGYGPILWQNGSKCTHNGKKWISRVDNNTWEPGGLGVYETIWEEVKDGLEA